MAASHQTEELVAADGTMLALHRWPAPERPRASLLIIHGYGEYGTRYSHVAEALESRQIACAAIDLRGQGRSGGRPGYVKEFDEYLKDAATALDAMGAEKPFVLGHSNGGLVALEVLSRTPDRALGAIVTNPFLELALKPPAPKLWAAKLAGALYPKLAMPAGLAPEQLTHDEDIKAFWLKDSQMVRVATAGWFKAVQTSQARVRALRNFELPLLYVYSDADPIASPATNAAFAKALGCPDKTIIERAGELHEVLNETNRAELIEAVGDWIEARL